MSHRLAPGQAFRATLSFAAPVHERSKRSRAEPGIVGDLNLVSWRAIELKRAHILDCLAYSDGSAAS